MFLSIFSDELGLDIRQGLPILRSWGLEHVDLRGRVFGYTAEALPPEQLPDLKKLLKDHGMAVGCLQSSLAKVHLPGEERQRAEAAKLEGIIRAADALDCRLVRSFHYWQPSGEQRGQLADLPGALEQVVDRFLPLARRAKAAGLTLCFENCGVTPDEVFAFLDALDVPEWALAWDVHNTWDCDERRRDEEAFVRRMAARARCVHVKARGATPDFGEAVIPYDRVLEILQSTGFSGPVSVETHNPDRSLSNEEASRKVVAAMQKAWPTTALAQGRAKAM